MYGQLQEPRMCLRPAGGWQADDDDKQVEAADKKNN